MQRQRDVQVVENRTKDATSRHQPSTILVVSAFAVIYIVWGSTYYFIRVAIEHIPPFIMASVRFLSAGGILLIWCAAKGEEVFAATSIKPAVIAGLLLLFFGNGAVVWGEQYLPSSLVAILTSASPFWFVVLDKRNWQLNFGSRETVLGLILGFIGVVLLLGEDGYNPVPGSDQTMKTVALFIMVLGPAFWAAGSLYSKYNSRGKSHYVNTAWQMIGAGAAFLIGSALAGEWSNFRFDRITPESLFSLIYLVLFGSLLGYTAFTWLLQVRSATMVSTHAYVNPLVAVLLGITLAGEKLTMPQWVGLTVVVSSVLLINLARYRRAKLAVK